MELLVWLLLVWVGFLVVVLAADVAEKAKE